MEMWKKYLKIFHLTFEVDGTGKYNIWANFRSPNDS